MRNADRSQIGESPRKFHKKKSSIRLQDILHVLVPNIRQRMSMQIFSFSSSSFSLYGCGLTKNVNGNCTKTQNVAQLQTQLFRFTSESRFTRGSLETFLALLQSLLAAAAGTQWKKNNPKPQYFYITASPPPYAFQIETKCFPDIWISKNRKKKNHVGK